MTYTPKLTIHKGARAWNRIWKWFWFTRDQWQPKFREWKDGTRLALASLLPKLGAKSVLDCSCGLGLKTIILAEMGYEAEGCDGSKVAVCHAQELADEDGQEIRFLQSRWDRLDEKCRRKYDCVYNDASAWITTRGALNASARGVYSVLKRGGKFIFQGADEWTGDGPKEPIIKQQYEKEGPFEALPVCERDGVRLTTLVVREMTGDGVLGSRIHVIDDRGTTRIEIAQVLDCCKWTWSDYVEAFRKAGFRRLYSVKERGSGSAPYILNVAVK